MLEQLALSSIFTGPQAAYKRRFCSPKAHGPRNSLLLYNGCRSECQVLVEKKNLEALKTFLSEHFREQLVPAFAGPGVRLF